jgi:hypothetical protein
MTILVGIFAAYILWAVCTTYIVTVVLVKGHIFTYFRCWFRMRTLWLIKGPPGDRRHLIDCRLCTGVWVALGIHGAVMVTAYAFARDILPPADLTLVLFLAGVFVTMAGAYFMVTQER